jgi:hypothetical protein
MNPKSPTLHTKARNKIMPIMVARYIAAIKAIVKVSLIDFLAFHYFYVVVRANVHQTVPIPLLRMDYVLLVVGNL